MADTLTKQDIINILPVNQMIYVKTSPASPVVERTQAKYWSEGGGSSTFQAGDHLIINMQSGVNWVDWLQSFLVFEANTTTEAAAVIGSILNLFSDSKISSRSGKEMDRTQELNVLNYHRIQNSPKELIEKNYNALFLANQWRTSAEIKLQTEAATYTGMRTVIGTTAETYMIPMKFLGDIFDSHKLMPSHLARGLRMDLTCEAVNRALTQHLAGVPSSYTITRPYVLADTYKLADSVLKYLNDTFASKETGLVYEYFSYYGTRTTVASQSLDIEVRRAASMAVDVFAVATHNAYRSQILADSFASIVADEKDDTQWRIGSHYLPNAPSVGITEHYAEMLYWGNKLRMGKDINVNYGQFKGAFGPVGGLVLGTWNRGLAKYCMTLQRNNILELSGVAINNSMTLAVNGALQKMSEPLKGVPADAAATSNSTVYVFLRHLRRAVLFLESLTLET